MAQACSGGDHTLHDQEDEEKNAVVLGHASSSFQQALLPKGQRTLLKSTTLSLSTGNLEGCEIIQ